MVAIKIHHLQLLWQEPICLRAQLPALDLPSHLCQACVFHGLLLASDYAHQSQGDGPIQQTGGTHPANGSGL